jgi:ribosome-binding factor A
MFRSNVREVKREKKKSLFLREFSALLFSLSQEEPGVKDVYVTRVDLSSDGSMCYVFFNAYPGVGDNVSVESAKEKFLKILEILKLYKPSMRRAFAKKNSSRYVPDFRFLYDETKDKERRINDLLNKVQEEELVKD